MTTYQNHQVEILDKFECGGIELAVIQAVEVKPFVGGDTYPVRTCYATVKVSDLGTLVRHQVSAPITEMVAVQP